MSETREDPRTAFEAGRWQAVVDALAGADAPDPADLERLAVAQTMLGRQRDAITTWQRAHQGALDAGDVDGAVRYAFWLVMELVRRQELAQAGGWLARMQRLIEERNAGGVAAGYLALVRGRRTFEGGDPGAARALFAEAEEIATRHDDRDLVILARHAQGRVAIRMGETPAGLSLLDEAMVGVLGGEASPLAAGSVYCSVLDACFEVLDLRRAQEYTAALSEWLGPEPGANPFQGECLLHRAEIKQHRGAWAEAIEESELACADLLRPPPHPQAGPALYRRGELARLAADLDAAESSFLEAEEYGQSPQPGLALVRLARGRAEEAAGMIRRSLEEAIGSIDRGAVLGAAVEILLAEGDLEGATSCAAELEAIAEKRGVPFTRGVARHALGSVRHAEGEAGPATAHLREALEEWRAIDCPYGAARTRVVLADCHEALGDTEAAAVERSRARETFERLGARTDLAELGGDRPRSAAGLTGRELEVLALVAAGKTNRAIAEELFISEKTVARHVSNIFAKIDVSSRAAATAYAYEHDLV